MLKNQFPRPTRYAILKILGENVVLVDVKEREIYRLNEVAAEIWRHIDGTHSVDDIVHRICTQFSVDRRDATADVREFLDQFVAAGLVEYQPPGA